MPSEPTVSDVCLACGTPLQGAYCHRCGQKAGRRVESLRQIAADGLGDLVSFDSRIVRTLRELFVRPGFLSTEWWRGRRSPYVPPFRLYLLVAAVFFLALSVTDLRLVNLRFSADEGGQTLEEALEGHLLRDSVLVLVELGEEEAQRQLIDRLGTLALLMPPLFALLSLVAYRRRRYYVEHLVFSLHLHAMVFLLLAVVVLTPWEPVRQVVGWGVIAPAIAVYYFLALHRSFGGRWWATALKGGLLGLVYLQLALPLVMVLGVLWVSWTA